MGIFFIFIHLIFFLCCERNCIIVFLFQPFLVFFHFYNLSDLLTEFWLLLSFNFRNLNLERFFKTSLKNSLKTFTLTPRMHRSFVFSLVFLRLIYLISVPFYSKCWSFLTQNNCARPDSWEYFFHEHIFRWFSPLVKKTCCLFICNSKSALNKARSKTWSQLLVFFLTFS